MKVDSMSPVMTQTLEVDRSLERTARTFPRIETGLWYLLAAGMALLIVVIVLRLWRMSIEIPLMYGGDDIYYQRMIQGVIESGWYYFSDRVGQPGGMDFRDFPVGDGWFHLGVIKLLAAIAPDPFVVWNLFFILTFPLVTLTMLYLCRSLDLAFPVAIPISLLYTFLPYHFWRHCHLFLAAYYLVPLSCLVILRIYQGRLPFLQGVGENRRWHWRSWSAAGWISLGMILGMGGVYYALFTLFFLAIVGISRAFLERKWTPIFSAGMVGGIICGSLFISLLPSIHYRLTEPKNAERPLRAPIEAEMYGLRVTQMVMPMTGHRVGMLRDFKTWYNTSGNPLINENDYASLGMIGSAGFLFLVGRLMFRRSPRSSLYDGLALLTVLAVLLATIGGFGSLLAWIFSPWVRGYNRIMVFIAAFALLAVGLWLQHLYQTWMTTRRRQLSFYGFLSLMLLSGILDQTNAEMIPPYKHTAAQWQNDAEFARILEAKVPPGGTIFQLPYRMFPESPVERDFIAYDLFRPYLHSKQLKISHGSLKGHPGDVWANWVAEKPIPALIDTLAEAGVAGLYIDRFAYLDKGVEMETQIQRILDRPPQCSRDSRFAYYDLIAYRELRRSTFSEAEWTQRVEWAQHPILPLYRDGFYLEQAFPDVGPGHLTNRVAEMHLHNDLPHDRSIQIRLYMDLPGRVQTAPVEIDGDLVTETVLVDVKGTTWTKDLVLSPGKHVIRFSCKAPAMSALADPYKRRIILRVAKVEIVE